MNKFNYNAIFSSSIITYFTAKTITSASYTSVQNEALKIYIGTVCYYFKIEL